MTGEETTYRCRASTASGERCSFRGTREQLAEHADEVGHPRCIIGGETLNEHERQTCQRCANRVRDNLDAIAVAYAHLERVLWQAAHRGIAWDALTLSGDGSMESPQTPNQYTQPRVVQPTVHVGHDAMTGEEFTHPAFLEERIPSDGREHVRDHWDNDPLSVLALLEAHERIWRHEFGHGPAVDIATVAGCLTYLRTWHTLAARTHPGFDDYAGEISALRNRIEHVVGMADDPKADPLPCACDGELVRYYGDNGLEDNRICRECGTNYAIGAYAWEMHKRTQMDGWVSVEVAAKNTDRPEQTIWAWVRAGHVPSACSRFTRRIVVELKAVEARSEQVGRVTRKTA